MKPDRASRSHVLVAEDDAEDLFLLLRALRRLDAMLAIEVTRDGVELCERLRTTARDALPRLMLLDLNLPRRDGREVLIHLRREGYDVPVVVLTTSREAADHERATTLGANEVLVKPDDHRDLEAMLRDVLARHPIRERGGPP